MEVDFLEKSREYIEEGSFEKAQIILRRVLSSNPKDARALELHGDLVLKLGRKQEAMQRYESASDSYTNSNKYAEAIICLEKIIRLDKSNEEVFTRLGDLYRFYGLPDRAIKTILDLCTWAMNNKQDAVFVSGLRKIVELQARNLALRLSFVKVLYSINRLQDAEDELKKLRSLAEEAGDEEILQQVTKLMPKTDGGEELDPKSRVELGNLLYEIGSKDEAIIEFEKAITDLLASNDTGEAINVLNRIIEIDPDNKDATKKLEELKQGGAAAPVEEKEVEQVPANVGDEVLEAAPEPVVSDDDIEGIIAESDLIDEQASDEIKAEPEEAKVSEEPAAEELSTVDEIIRRTVSEARESTEDVPAEKSEPVTDTEQEPDEGLQGLEMFEDLGKEIEGFVAATDTSAQEPSSATEVPTGTEHDPHQLEGQIADIEFLLNEAEAPSIPSFEIAQEYDDFRKAIRWQESDIKKKLTLAHMAFHTGLYQTALNYVSDIKEQKETWPLSLEINGGSLIKLGRYSEARKVIAPALLYEEISEAEKVELRYLLASAYEGLGDFDNALRETERIISINPNYKDVKEMYTLMGGKGIDFQTPAAKPEPVTPPIQQQPEAPPLKQPPIQALDMEPQGRSQEPFVDESYPTIIEKSPPVSTKKPADSVSKKEPDIEERKGENIAFL
jgi:tetratricopeptide (TPR) repeat protein